MTTACCPDTRRLQQASQNVWAWLLCCACFGDQFAVRALWLGPWYDFWRHCFLAFLEVGVGVCACGSHSLCHVARAPCAPGLCLLTFRLLNRVQVYPRAKPLISQWAPAYAYHDTLLVYTSESHASGGVGLRSFYHTVSAGRWCLLYWQSVVVCSVGVAVVCGNSWCSWCTFHPGLYV